MDEPIAPARIVLRQAEHSNAVLGHENLGFLSERNGFIPVTPPILDLPAPYDAWTGLAAELPRLCQNLRVRQALDQLPRLSARAGDLDDRYLLRASSVLSILTQAYHNVEVPAPQRLPESLAGPWQEVAWRLGKPRWTMSTTDYMFYNWRFVDAGAADPMRVENLRLLTPIWDHPGVEVFMLVVLEMLAQATPLVMGVVRAQEAALREDRDALKQELAGMSDTLARLTYDSLLKANPNEYCGAFFTDTLAWTKLFAMLPLPLRAGVHNASGVETPFFHLMDEFFEREKYDTQLGVEAQAFRSAFPPHWKLFLQAVRQVSVREFVDGSGDRELKGLFRETVEGYQGPYGLLARHRLKAYAFLDTAFKTGRTSTVTGFSGLFKDRAWDLVDTSFEDSRVERHRQYPARAQFARIERVIDLQQGGGPPVRRVIFDVKGLGLRYQAGDRLGVLPENREELVARTLASLRCEKAADLPVTLSARWQEAAALRDGCDGVSELPLKLLLSFGQIRPVSREVAKRLYAISHCDALHAILEQRLEDQWELWDLLDLLSQAGFDVHRLLNAHPGERHHICQIVPPMAHRLYSISSAPEDPARPAERIELTVGQLNYRSAATEHSHAEPRQGTASAYLCRDRAPGSDARRTPVWIVHPPRFALPKDAATPVIMVAGGTGFAPFRGFLQERAKAPGGRNILLLGLRDADSLLYREELESLAANGQLELHAALSREEASLGFDRASGRYVSQPAQALRVPDLLRGAELGAELRELLLQQGACLYVCGRADFARAVMDALVEVLGGQQALYRLIGEDRYMQDVFTTYTGSTAEKTNLIDVSELLHCNTAQRMWANISGRVYDLTEFAHMHPGGRRLIWSNAGTDATHAYRKVEHHANPEVDSMLSMFEIGLMRRLHFGASWVTAIGEQGMEHLSLSRLFRMWTRFAYLIVEIENAYQIEVSIRDESLSRYQPDAQPSAYKLQFEIEAHRRFISQTIAYLCEELGKLWWSSCGLFDDALDVRWLDGRLREIAARPVAERGRGWNEGLAGELDRLARPGDPQKLEAHVLALQQADADFLMAIKMAIAAGVASFEQHTARTRERGRDDVANALRRVASIAQAYYEQVDRAIDAYHTQGG